MGVIMSAVVKMTFRIHGEVAFTDGSSGGYAAVFEDGLVKADDDSSLIFRQLYVGANRTIINSALALFTGVTHALTPTAVSGAKTVNSFTFVVSGRIARADGTKNDFSVRRDIKGGVQSETPTYFEQAVDSTQKPNLISTWEQLVGAGKASLT